MQKDRKKIISKAAAALVGIAGVALLLVGCNVGGAGIFYTLEKATAQTTSGIGDSRTIGSGAYVSGTPGVYYVAAGTVYGAVASSTPTWEKVSPPPGATSDICTSLAVSGTTLYAVFFDPNADTTSSFYLYQATLSSNNSVDTAPNWTAVSGFDTNSSFTVQEVYSVNNNVLVMVMDNPPSSGSSSGLYELYQVTIPTTPILTGLQDPPSAGTYDGTNYWFIGGYSSPGTSGGPALYKGTALAALTQVPSSSVPSLSTGQVFRSIYYSSTLNTVFVSTSPVNNVPGGVYASQAGGAWTSNSIVSWPSGTTQTGLDGFDEYSVSSTLDAILVGADTGGYYEIDVNPTTFSASSANTSPIGLGQPGNTTTETAGADYVSTTLASAHVIGFFNVPAPATPGAAASGSDQIFALTQNGLWLNQFPSGSTQRTWTLQ